MMEKELLQEDAVVLLMLNQQKQQMMDSLKQITAAEGNQVDMLVKKYDMPEIEGRYVVAQRDGKLFLMEVDQ